MSGHENFHLIDEEYDFPSGRARVLIGFENGDDASEIEHQMRVRLLKTYKKLCRRDVEQIVAELGGVVRAVLAAHET